MAAAYSFDRVSSTIATGVTNQKVLDFNVLDPKSELVITVTTDKALTVVVWVGRQTDAPSSYIHKFSMAADNTIEGDSYPITRTFVVLLNPAIPFGRISLNNSSGATATFTLDAGVQNA